MNLFEMLTQAQGGNGLQSLGRQYGLSPDQTQAAVEALMPAFSQGLKRTTSDANGFGALLQALASGGHARYADDAGAAFTEGGMADGNGILGHLFGSKELSRAVAQQASQATGISAETLKQMLPALAAMVMGGLFQQTAGQASAAAPQASAAGGFGSGSGNILGDIITEMMKQAPQQQPQSRRAPQGQPEAGDNPLGQILKDVLGGALGGGTSKQQPQTRAPQEAPAGNPLEQILKDMFGGGQGQPQAEPRSRQQAPDPRGQNPLGDNPLGRIFEEMLGGGKATRGRQSTEDAPSRQQPSGKQRNPYDDIFGQLRESGSRQSEDYKRGIETIFDQYKRGMDRFR